MVTSMRAGAPEDLLGKRFNLLDLRAFLSEPDEAPKVDQFRWNADARLPPGTGLTFTSAEADPS
jgi:hypothetical protein